MALANGLRSFVGNGEITQRLPEPVRCPPLGPGQRLFRLRTECHGQRARARLLAPRTPACVQTDVQTTCAPGTRARGASWKGSPGSAPTGPIPGPGTQPLSPLSRPLGCSSPPQRPAPRCPAWPPVHTVCCLLSPAGLAFVSLLVSPGLRQRDAAG